MAEIEAKKQKKALKKATNAAEPKAKSTKFSLKPTSEPEVNYISLSTDDWVAVAFENMWYIGNNYHHIPSSLDL